MTPAASRAAALLLLPSLWLAGTAGAEPPAATAAPATAAAAPAPPETVKLEPPPPPAPPTPDDIIASATRIALENGMIIEDLRPGRGAPALPGVNATVYYAGWLYDRSKPDWKGKLFDSALARCPERAGVFSGATSAAQPCRTTPFVFPVGARRVIPGWDIGLIGMKVGGKRRLVIPAKLAYGDRGAGGVIPPGSTLVFEIELLSFFTTTSTTGR